MCVCVSTQSGTVASSFDLSHSRADRVCHTAEAIQQQDALDVLDEPTRFMTLAHASMTFYLCPATQGIGKPSLVDIRYVFGATL